MALFLKAVDVHQLTPEQRAALQPGQHITASGAKGRWIGQSKRGTDVAAWQENARAFPKDARAYRAALREYLRGLNQQHESRQHG